MARSRAHDFAAKQRSILRSAAAVFAEVGMDKASMSQIAAHADVSKALLYHYYPGRDALIFDILRTNLTELDEAIAAADQPDLPPRQRLRALVHAVLEQYRDADDYHKVQLNGTQTLPQDQRDEIMAIERRIVRRFAAVIRQVNPELEAERPILMPVTMSIFGMMNWVYMWFKEGGPVSRAEYADLATDILLGGIERLR
ncbi:TetR family transcriptional regulator [Roseinatronobacter thiooxidans]|uniref:TetR family transcriptional regulator n=1 Tax=Roseinatronobacter thiooxidans TaxID=121821 RepID=A0A2W7PKG9_9RHOB|nr:TetR/AcrR family transcriptional regulator [Roseinatronobacter thiooxidans]PZX36731.1 TetR family transcriptional regulator [Roseinatronobacter thiooxidans]